MKNYTPEQIEFTQDHNEELLHIFGYADDDDPKNITPFFDYKGKADPKSVRLFNNYQFLNEMAVKKRMAQRKKHLQTPPRDIKINLPEEKPLLKMISHFNVMKEIYLNT